MTATSAGSILTFSSLTYPRNHETKILSFCQYLGDSMLQMPVNFGSCKSRMKPVLATAHVEEMGDVEVREEKSKFKWVEIRPNGITEAQKQAISQLPPKMTKRCKALMKQLICCSCERGSLSDLLGAWARIMRPRRTDWLSVLKELKRVEHPLYLEVAELALTEESFEANIRDYTKIIHCHGKQNQLQDAERVLTAMKRRGFMCDQVTLTTMVHIYSKAGNLKLAEETFEELKLLGQPLDKRSYGSMIMAYIRAGMPEEGEALLKEMDTQEICAGSEIYKALLRAYSMVGNTGGAQRVFGAIQLAGIAPDARVCGLIITAYRMAGQSLEARIAFENMRRAGLEASDKCVALVLAAYEMESKVSEALDFLLGLERDGHLIGQEASKVLAGWFRRLGVVKDVELVLRECAVPVSEARAVSQS